MTPKKPAKPKWPALVQMVKNSTAADSANQKKTSAAAKRSAIQFSGKDTRTYGHTSAAGKHSQAKRDAK